MSSGRPRAERKIRFSAPRASSGRPSLEVEPQQVRGLLAERHDALLAALAADVDLLGLELDVGELEPARPPRPQARRVDELEERAVAQPERRVAARLLEQRVGLRGAGRVREPAPPASGQREVGNPRRAERRRRNERTAASLRPSVDGASLRGRRPGRSAPSQAAYSANARASSRSSASFRRRSQPANSSRSARYARLVASESAGLSRKRSIARLVSTEGGSGPRRGLPALHAVRESRSVGTCGHQETAISRRESDAEACRRARRRRLRRRGRRSARMGRAAAADGDRAEPGHPGGDLVRRAAVGDPPVGRPVPVLRPGRRARARPDPHQRGQRDHEPDDGPVVPRGPGLVHADDALHGRGPADRCDGPGREGLRDAAQGRRPRRDQPGDGEIEFSAGRTRCASRRRPGTCSRASARSSRRARRSARARGATLAPVRLRLAVHDLVLASWPVDPTAIRRAVGAGLRPAAVDGRHLVSVVALRFGAGRLGRLPVLPSPS